MSNLGHCERCADVGKSFPDDAAPVGKIGNVGGVEAYIVGNDAENVVVVCTDIFGHTFVNSQRNADAYAAAGFTVYVPKTLNDAFDPALSIEQIMAQLPTWSQRNTTDNARDVAIKVINHLRSTGTVKKIYAVGFCFGGRQVVDLLQRKLIDGGVIYHPGRVQEADAEGCKGVPTLWQLSETDNAFPPNVVEHFKKVLANEPHTEFHTYPGTVHGFGVRPSNDEERKQMLISRADTAEWLRSRAHGGK